MKKNFPTFIIFAIFLSFFISQFFLNGQELSASKAKTISQKYESFEYEFSKLNGMLVSGEKLLITTKNKEFVLLNFWASWCIPCLPKLKKLSAIHSRLPKNVQILGVNLDDKEGLNKAKKILQEYNSKFPNIVDNNGLIGEKFLVTGLPYSILFQNGKVKEIFNEKNELDIDELLESF